MVGGAEAPTVHEKAGERNAVKSVFVGLKRWPQVIQRDTCTDGPVGASATKGTFQS